MSVRYRDKDYLYKRAGKTGENKRGQGRQRNIGENQLENEDRTKNKTRQTIKIKQEVTKHSTVTVVLQRSRL